MVLVILLQAAGHLAGQTQTTITTMDFVKIKKNMRDEAIFYYTHNWKVYRDIALENKFIKSYRLLTTSADTTANFDLILITEYTDSLQFRLSEERFQQIIKATRPEGPGLLNEVKPADFRQNVFYKETETLFSSEKMKGKRKNR